MNKYWKGRWIKALLSGEFRQSKGFLHVTKAQLKNMPNDQKAGYCCLGVLCAINPKVEYEISDHAGTTYTYKGKSAGGDLSSEYPPKNLTKELGINIHDQHELARMNDAGKSFKQIADWIRINL